MSYIFFSPLFAVQLKRHLFKVLCVFLQPGEKKDCSSALRGMRVNRSIESLALEL